MDHPEPHVTIGQHPELGYVALNTADLFVADRILKQLGFQPVPGSKLYALTQPDQDGNRRTRQAITSLRAARYRVDADLTLDPGPPSARQGDAHERPLVRGAVRRTTATAQAAVSRSAALADRTGLPPIPPRPGTPAVTPPGPSSGRAH
ncbi:hypothetical protein [Streptomyces klenkii]